MKRWLVVLIVLMTGCAAVQSPTATSTVSFTPTLIQTATPGTPIAIPMHDLEIRSGPGTGYSIAGMAKAGVPLVISGMSPNGQWILINHDIAPGGNWLALSSFVTFSGNLNTVQAFEPSPSPAAWPALIPSRQLTARSGPGLSFPIVGLVEAEAYLLINAISEDGLWALISPIGWPQQWIALSRLVKTDGNLAAAEIYLPIPTNSPAPFAPTVKILAALGARYLPGENATYTVTLDVGQEFEIVARSADGAWYGLRLSDMIVWIPASPSVDIVGDLSLIPVVTPSPTPSNTPSPTATVTPTQIPTVDEEAIVSTVVSRVLATLTAQVTPTSEPD